MTQLRYVHEYDQLKKELKALAFLNIRERDVGGFLVCTQSSMPAGCLYKICKKNGEYAIIKGMLYEWNAAVLEPDELQQIEDILDLHTEAWP